MLSAGTLLTILSMALVTYLTRILGYWVLRNRTLSARTNQVLEAIPGSVLISVIAPAFTSPRPANIIALALTALAATRLSILPTVIIGVGSTALLRHFLG